MNNLPSISNSMSIRMTDEEQDFVRKHLDILIFGLENEPKISQTQLFYNMSKRLIDLDKTPIASDEDTLNMVETLKQENEALQRAINGTEDSKGFKTLLDEAREEIESLKAENEDLSNTEPKIEIQTKEIEKPLNENQEVISIPKSIRPILEDMKLTESKRVNKSISTDELLLNLFYAQVTDGPGDHLPKTYSKKEIIRILEKAKTDNE